MHLGSDTNVFLIPCGCNQRAFLIPSGVNHNVVLIPFRIDPNTFQTSAAFFLKLIQMNDCLQVL